MLFVRREKQNLFVLSHCFFLFAVASRWALSIDYT